ncbi:MAG: hypothetical protein Q9219_004855 [cf. Caloplaca sp. 3 TL-2023]
MFISSGGRKHLEITTPFLILTVAAVYSRFVGRWRTRVAVGADDWTLLVAFVFVLAMYVEGLVLVLGGGIGRHMKDLSPAELTILLKCYLACWITFAATFALSKISILLLYNRLFPIPSMRIACWVTGGFALAMGVEICLTGFLQCRPLEYVWDKTTPGGSCMNVMVVFYNNAAFTLAINTVVILLPLPVLWGLQMKKTHKVGVIAIFLLGNTIINSAILIVVEPCVAIISICLPTMMPALRDLASYTTIEYLKAICRIKTAFQKEGQSGEQAMIHESSREDTEYRVPDCRLGSCPRGQLHDGFFEV